MGTVDMTADVRETIIERPGLVVVVAFFILLAADFGLKLLQTTIQIGGVHLIGGQLPFPRLLTLLWDGLVIGLAIGLAGIGLSMTYSILSFANFSHGDYVTSGAFAGWAVTFLIAGLSSGQGSLGYLLSIGTGQGPSSAELAINIVNTPVALLVGLIVAIFATVVVSLVVDRYVYRPMRGEGAISLLIASIGVALVLRYLIVFMFTGTNRGLTAGGGRLEFASVEGQVVFEWVIRQPGQTDTVLFDIGLPFIRFGDYTAELLAITSAEATLVGIAVVLMGGLHVVLQFTKLGKAMRAMADNKSLAQITGIPTERVIRATWIIGGGLAGAAGFLIALERGTLSFNLGWVLLLLIFAAVILGGIGSVYGAMVGGVVIGLTETLSLIWIPASFTTAAAFAIMILMLLFKPDGLYGGVTTA
ncbi:MAG: branched-chain amino acid ABC transporter permease [Halobacteriales archaeon]